MSTKTKNVNIYNICGHNLLNYELGYVAHDDKAARNIKSGKKQTQCPTCGLWLFPEEYKTSISNVNRDPFHAKQKMYQIRLLRDGCGSFLYFRANKGIEDMACALTNIFLKKKRENGTVGSIFNPPYQPIKTISVVEYDNETKKPKRGGEKFKLRLSWLEMKFLDGSKIRNEWYEPVEN